MNRAEWKATAKMRMAQSNPSYLKVMLLWVLAAVVVPQVALNAIDSSVNFDLDHFYALVEGGFDPMMALQALQVSSGWMAASGLLSIVIMLYQGVMSFGLASYSLNLYQGEECGPNELFCGFSMAGRVIGARFLVGLFTVLWAMLLYIPLIFVIVGMWMSLATMDIFVWSVFVVLAVIAYAIALYAIILRYALVNFALADRPELGALGAIQYAKSLIRGHKWEYFVLVLSFLGWAVLCGLLSLAFSLVLYCGLFPVSSVWLNTLIAIVLQLPTYLWLTPYMNTTIAGFYENLSSQGFIPFQPGPQQ